jgi:hypothetical protein
MHLNSLAYTLDLKQPRSAFNISVAMGDFVQSSYLHVRLIG